MNRIRRGARALIAPLVGAVIVAAVAVVVYWLGGRRFWFPESVIYTDEEGIAFERGGFGGVFPGSSLVPLPRRASGDNAGTFPTWTLWRRRIVYWSPADHALCVWDLHHGRRWSSLRLPGDCDVEAITPYPHGVLISFKRWAQSPAHATPPGVLRVDLISGSRTLIPHAQRAVSSEDTSDIAFLNDRGAIILDANGAERTLLSPESGNGSSSRSAAEDASDPDMNSQGNIADWDYNFATRRLCVLRRDSVMIYKDGSQNGRLLPVPGGDSVACPVGTNEVWVSVPLPFGFGSNLDAFDYNGRALGCIASSNMPFWRPLLLATPSVMSLLNRFAASEHFVSPANVPAPAVPSHA